MAELYMPVPVQPASSKITSSASLEDDIAWSSSTDAFPSQTRTSPTPEPEVTPDDGAHYGTRRTRKRQQQWRKLLWVEQDFPDNWVDPTFLKDLQRNRSVQPYNFYSLVADSTVVVQHLSAMMIFITSFIAIYANRISPVSVVGVSSVLTVAGWTVWELGWGMREAARERAAAISMDTVADSSANPSNFGSTSNTPSAQGEGLGIKINHAPTPRSPETTGSYFPPNEKPQRPVSSAEIRISRPSTPLPADHSKRLRRIRIFTTAKSALLIYFTLLGLSPILRSLTKSISEDSIWAIATWLFLLNLISFDYGSGIERKFPAPFSTNVAITAAVVLASRLPSTTHVFSLMLFSIQVFGLFPVFRRYIKHLSWGLHVLLTVGLVLGAAGGLGYAVGWGWAVMYIFTVVVGMGACGWWMIDLQKYKNEIHGPWDPARPVLRRQ